MRKLKVGFFLFIVLFLFSLCFMGKGEVNADLRVFPPSVMSLVVIPWGVTFFNVYASALYCPFQSAPLYLLYQWHWPLSLQ